MSSLPLLVTCDEALLDDVLRLAAAAGTTFDVAHDAASAVRSWVSAPVVLVGGDQVARVAEQRPGRRDEVYVVTRGSHADDRLFRSALGTGAAAVVELPAGETWLVELLTDAADGTTRGARTIGVIGGCGGVGATTFACALALTAAQRGPTLLVDLDQLGPGLDRVAGLDDDAGVRWDALTGSHGRLGSRSLRDALPHRGDLTVLTWAPGRPAALDRESVREVLSAGRRGHDVVVLDLPRHVDGLVADALGRCDDVVVVVEASVTSVAAAGKLLEQLRPWVARLGVVVRDPGVTVAGDQVAAALDLPLLAELSTQRRLAEHLGLGLGPVHSRRSPLARAARAVLGRLPAESALPAVS
jgi:secretion/DNA translocation related CpaE-like protein